MSVRGTEGVCPNCGVEGLREFYRVDQVPVHSVLLMATREEALTYPKGDIRLAHCASCQFITNVAFDPRLQEYDERYEESQGCSETFNAFHRQLALDLIERFDLRGKRILEIGCGKGEFLHLLCELGDNRGLGFDPAFIDDRLPPEAGERLSVVKDFYTERDTADADFVVCKMTLEHIPRTAAFLGGLRRGLGDRTATRVFFQVPDVTRMLDEVAFWDVYYEHCSYFGPASLARLFTSTGFDVDEIWRDFGAQYLMIAARPSASGAAAGPVLARDDNDLAPRVQAYAGSVADRQEEIRHRIGESRARGGGVVLWGGGSKAVALLTTLGLDLEIQRVVDINPRKHGSFLPGTGQEVVGPEALRADPPALVIVMNRIYRHEIEKSLRALEIDAELLCL